MDSYLECNLHVVCGERKLEGGYWRERGGVRKEAIDIAPGTLLTRVTVSKRLE
jgi:hypothetical protein